MAKLDYVFQTDSSEVNDIFQKRNNYLIEYSKKRSTKEKKCALYFSSNEIYYPNTSDSFQNKIVKKDRFEWYHTRVDQVDKHIFIRDIKKQWYLTGISAECNSIEKLGAFLKKEIEGYKVICIGSSAGGFAAVLFGSILNAEAIYSFNGQFFLYDLLSISTANVDPIIFREKDNKLVNQYYSLKKKITKPENIFYFYSDRSKWDISQYEHISNLGIQVIPFRTSHHGIPFLKTNMNFVINNPRSWIRELVGKVQYPLFFSIKIEGVYNTILSLYNQLKIKYWN